MAYEVESDGMSAEARFILMECAEASATSLNIGVDPLEILIQLEQLAMEENLDIHDYITQFLGVN